MTDSRVPPPFLGDERAMLDNWLDWHRETLAVKCAGLSEERQRHGQDCSHRWILVHMIEEYARHNGHADMLREQIDGVTGE